MYNLRDKNWDSLNYNKDLNKYAKMCIRRSSAVDNFYQCLSHPHTLKTKMWRHQETAPF